MMTSKAVIISLMLLHLCNICKSQAIDYSPAFRSTGKNKPFRFSYENDFFSPSDRDYTQGMYLELIHPSLNKVDFPKFLWRAKLTQQLYGLAFFNTSLDPQTMKRLTRTMTIGVPGPLAGGKEIQSSIHRYRAQNGWNAAGI